MLRLRQRAQKNFDFSFQRNSKFGLRRRGNERKDWWYVDKDTNNRVSYSVKNPANSAPLKLRQWYVFWNFRVRRHAWPQTEPNHFGSQLHSELHHWHSSRQTHQKESNFRRHKTDGNRLAMEIRYEKTEGRRNQGEDVFREEEEIEFGGKNCYGSAFCQN